MSVLSDDDSDFKENGDLGLGLGLKPGGLRLNFNDNNNCQGIPLKKSTQLYTPIAQNKYRTLPFLKSKKSDIKIKQTGTAEETPVQHHTRPSCELENQSQGCCSRVMNKSPDLLKKIGKEEIERKLKTAEEEVEELKCEIEVYQKRLDAKYKAIAILREQSKKLQDFREVQKKKTYKYNHSLEQEVNKLHFELDQKEVSLENSQAIWAERFDKFERRYYKTIIKSYGSIDLKEGIIRQSLSHMGDRFERRYYKTIIKSYGSIDLKEVKKIKEGKHACSEIISCVCRENSSLTSVLEEKNKALQKVAAQNKGLSRERDDRSSDDHYSNYTSAEIAVLGACKCRVTSPEPCGCAHAAAHLRQEVSRLKSLRVKPCGCAHAGHDNVRGMIMSPEPCGCAHAAAHLRQEVSRLKSQSYFPEPCGCAHAAAHLRQEVSRLKSQSYFPEPCGCAHAAAHLRQEVSRLKSQSYFPEHCGCAHAAAHLRQEVSRLKSQSYFPEPCGCAHAAAHLRQEVSRLKSQSYFPEPCGCAHAAAHLRQEVSRLKSQSYFPEPCGCAHAAAHLRQEVSRLKSQSYFPEPCGCAHAAAHLRQEVSRLKSQVESHKKRKKEVMLTVDAYRQAFEEQLQKNKVFLSQLTSMAVPGTNKLERAKAVFRFLLETLNDDDLMRRTVSNSKLGVCLENGEVDNRPLTDRELVLVLTQILHERNEAYAHQKIASQVLAEKVKQLETQLSQQDEVFSS
ncbi:unnamed protein product [Mytilus edulis]|uniref:Uncharacterized protein n=1 Tax=Mytilus edulis TaxID=6550 RepID=A0A8S3SSE3_MYTED|nr:unnamed protein product [Mytilus edulis]